MQILSQISRDSRSHPFVLSSKKCKLLRLKSAAYLTQAVFTLTIRQTCGSPELLHSHVECSAENLAAAQMELARI